MEKLSTFATFLLSEVVFIPFCAALFRWKRIDKDYYPFFFLLGLAAFSELASFLEIHVFHSNGAVVNIYELLECTLIIYQFYRWHGARMERKSMYILQSASLVLWTFCNLILFHLNDYSFPLYRILYPFLVVILSINEINRMIIHDNGQLYKNARFMLCLAFIIYFLYLILYEGAYLVSKVEKTEVLSSEIISLFSKVNAFTNGLYLLVVLLIPRRRDSAFERIFDQIRDDN